MRILYLQQILVLPESAGNDRCWEFACHWRDAGHEVTFITSPAGFGPSDRQPGERVRDGIRIVAIDVPYAHKMPFPKRVVSFVSFFLKAKKAALRLPKPDVVVAYSAPLSVGELGRQLARHWQVPLVFEVADVWPDVPAGMGVIPRGPWLAWLYRRTRRIYAQAQVIVPFTPGMKQQIEAHGVPPAKVKVVYNGVGENARRVNPQPKDGQRPVRVLYLGTLGVANRADQLVRAVALLEKEMESLPPFEVQVVGSGNDEKRFLGEIARLGVQSVVYRGQVARSEIGEILAGADVGVISFAPFPVLEANGATKFFDYLAAGLPVVINYGGWQAEWLERHLCGMWSPQGDEASFAWNLARLIEHSVLREEMGSRAKASAGPEFDRKNLALYELSLIESAINA